MHGSWEESSGWLSHTMQGAAKPQQFTRGYMSFSIHVRHEHFSGVVTVKYAAMVRAHGAGSVPSPENLVLVHRELHGCRTGATLSQLVDVTVPLFFLSFSCNEHAGTQILERLDLDDSLIAHQHVSANSNALLAFHCSLATAPERLVLLTTQGAAQPFQAAPFHAAKRPKQPRRVPCRGVPALKAFLSLVTCSQHGRGCASVWAREGMQRWLPLRSLPRARS